jgi:hypothetical protein
LRTFAKYGHFSANHLFGKSSSRVATFLATFSLEYERFTGKNPRQESWRNHDIVDG